MKVTANVDRFEEEWAILIVDEKIQFQLPASLIPASIKEGDWIDLTIKENKTKEQEVLQNVKSLMDELKSGEHLK